MDQDRGIITAQGVRAPGCLGADALLRPGPLNGMERLVFVKEPQGNRCCQGHGDFMPEALDLFLRWHGIQNTLPQQELLYRQDGQPGRFSPRVFLRE